LAQIQLLLGEEEEAAKVLRMLVQQEPGDLSARQQLIRALALAGKASDAQRELAFLRPLDLHGAAELDRVLAEVGTDGSGHALLPVVEIFELAGKSAEEHKALRAQVDATLARVFRNLGTLHIQAGRVNRAGENFSDANQVHSENTAKALGRVDLSPAVPQLRVKLQGIDPAALKEAVFGGEPSAPVMGILRLLDNGQLREAEDGLHQLLAQRDEPKVRDLLGVLLSHLKRYDEAERELRAVIEVTPRSFSARQHLARVALLKSHRGQAAKHLRFAAELGQLERDLALELVAMEIADQRIPAANRQLRAVSRHFESTRATLQLAEIALGLGNYKLALDFSERARRFSPNSEEVLSTHARCALAARIPSTAWHSVESLARMHPTVAEHQVLLGQVWIQLGKMGEAADPLLRALELDPQHGAAFLPLGLVLNHESRYDEARTYLAKHLRSQPEDLEALAALAESEERLGDLEAAEERAQGVVAKDPNHATANLVLGMLHMRQGRFAEAREVLEKAALVKAAEKKAVTASSASAKAHYQLSLAYARLGDSESAERHLELYRKAQKGAEGTYALLEAVPSVSVPARQVTGEMQN
jgi:tetratricopeptide (TPR) repeat protein